MKKSFKTDIKCIKHSHYPKKKHQNDNKRQEFAFTPHKLLARNVHKTNNTHMGQIRNPLKLRARNSEIEPKFRWNNWYPLHQIKHIFHTTQNQYNLSTGLLRKIKANLSVKSIPAQKHPMHKRRLNFRDTTLFEFDSAPLLFQDIVHFSSRINQNN